MNLQNIIKAKHTPDGRDIIYLPIHFNSPDTPLKSTSNIIPITGFDGSCQALLVKPEVTLYIQTNALCNAKCPNCLLKYKGKDKGLMGCLLFSKKFFMALKFAARHMNIQRCSITGGEPTLFTERLISLFDVLPKTFKNKTLFSNGAKLLSKTSRGTFLEALISKGLTSLVINCVHPNEKKRGNFLVPLITNNEYKKIVEICFKKNIEVRLSWVFDNKKSCQNKINEKINELISLAKYLKVPEVILRVSTEPNNQNSKEVKQSKELWEKCKKYIDSLIVNTSNIVERIVKTRAYYKINDLIVILEVYHEPRDMKTDAGTIMLFSGANPSDVHMTYRWYNGLKSYSINYQSKPWASNIFFQRKFRKDPYKKVLDELK